MTVISSLLSKLGLQRIPQASLLPGEIPPGTTEAGRRPTPENQLSALTRQMGVDYSRRAAILEIRAMDCIDPRVKKIHWRMARTAIKGGLKIRTASTNKTLIKAWKQFERRLHLHRREKLESDCRGFAMEGNLPIQWVLDQGGRVVAGVRMPSETIKPVVGDNGAFRDPQRAYEQYDIHKSKPIATFALWQLSLVRLTPDNYDDMGSMGRPYLDASRAVWRKLDMTEEDLVIRRRTRAPLRMAHVLEGAGEEDIDKYRAQVENDQNEITTDFYLNRKGGVTPVQGDANLDQIADVSHLLDTFFSGAPAPKGLFGYPDGLSRDILEDLKRDFFDEIDALQDTLSFVYDLGFRLDLLLQGINPENFDFDIIFAERRTDTPNQRADLALKYQALGAPNETVFDAAGLDPANIRDQLEAESNDPYPSPLPESSAGPNVSITPGNARKGGSATTISTRTKK